MGELVSFCIQWVTRYTDNNVRAAVELCLFHDGEPSTVAVI